MIVHFVNILVLLYQSFNIFIYYWSGDIGLGFGSVLLLEVSDSILSVLGGLIYLLKKNIVIVSIEKLF